LVTTATATMNPRFDFTRTGSPDLMPFSFARSSPISTKLFRLDDGRTLHVLGPEVEMLGQPIVVATNGNLSALPKVAQSPLNTRAAGLARATGLLGNSGLFASGDSKGS